MIIFYTVLGYYVHMQPKVHQILDLDFLFLEDFTCAQQDQGFTFNVIPMIVHVW